jgi:hypothetical protein
VVRVSCLPGFEPPKPISRKRSTKLPFLASIAAGSRAYEVEVGEIGLRFVRWL